MRERLVAVLALLALMYTSSASAQLVQRVIDGDTVAVAGIGTVRLIGVDTPETVDPRKPVERFGQEASTFLRAMVQNKVVRLDYDQQRTDKYGRTLAYLYLPDGTFVNAEIVKEGFGHAYTAFPFRYMEEFRGYEREARGANRGLWAVTPLAVAAPAAEHVDEKVTVYVTRTGKMYHSAGCRYLARSQIPMQLGEAATRYGACSVCKPATLRTPAVPSPVVAAPRTTTPTPSVSAGRCQATTQKGTQCSRNAQAGRTYCWQH
jgi:micrococcal nuclease